MIEFKKDKKKGWFRLKRYPHIGLPFENKDRLRLTSYIKNKEKISTHSFSPFIHKTIIVRKFRRKKFDDGSRSAKRISGNKPREIYYASHFDSLIFSYYANLLNKNYEKRILEKLLGNNVTAYRKIQIDPNNPNSRNKCNIDFAKEVFDYISENKERKLAAITFDISSFFDNLDHKILKEKWRMVMNFKEQLPSDHYAIFRNITKFSYVEIQDLFEEFKNEIIFKKKNGTLGKIYVPRLELLKEKNAVAFCETKDLSDRVRNMNIIKKNKWTYENGIKILREKGVPQGSPISAILANLYLIDFDFELKNYISELGGLYRRYSDDMVVVIDEDKKDAIIRKFQLEIQQVKLEIQPAKTQIFIFKKFEGEFRCKEFNQTTGILTDNNKFDYLGFSFDGKSVYLKSSGLSKYYRKMKISLARGSFYAKYGKNKERLLFKNRLYKKFTHLGSERRKIFIKDPLESDKWIETSKYDWGNFLSYVKLAERIFSKDNSMYEVKIQKQVKSSWNKFHLLMSKKEKAIEKYFDGRK
tara:strand:+ start:486 stop:2066 length:1581 start_codon:yes stop_codon:yes gene_type:complete